MAVGTQSTKPIQEVRKFICYDAVNNNNKFYDLTIFTDDTWQGYYGRVGVTGTYTENFSNSGSKAYNKIIAEKLKKGYVPFEVIQNLSTSKIIVATAQTDLKAVSRQIRTNSPEADKLIDRLIAENVHKITENTSLKYDVSRGTFSTPLGIITDAGIAKARQTLVDISSYVQQGDYQNSNLVDLVNNYFRTVPKNFGMKIPALDQIFPDLFSIQAQNDILDSLDASLQLVLKGDDKTEDDKPKIQQLVFDAKIHLVEDEKIIDYINKLYMSTNKAMHVSHTLRVKSVYEIEIGHMARAFESEGKGVGNVKRLWHGTGVANILSILKSGFQLSPPSTTAVTGKSFGDGIYFSDQSTKSLNYAAGYWAGQRNKQCMMFLNDVSMGKELIPTSSSQCSGWRKPPAGYDSVFAKSGKTSYLQNNEMIVFKTSQINPVYLVEFA